MIAFFYLVSPISREIWQLNAPRNLGFNTLINNPPSVQRYREGRVCQSVAIDTVIRQQSSNGPTAAALFAALAEGFPVRA